MVLYRRPGTLFWRVCSPPFHNALERQYSQMIPVETFLQRKSNGQEVSWTHDLFQMLQINRSTGQVKPLQRIRSSPPVPCAVWVSVFFFTSRHGCFCLQSFLILTCGRSCVHVRWLKNTLLHLSNYPDHRASLFKFNAWCFTTRARK